MYQAKVIADSLSPSGQRITTFQLNYWLPIHAEAKTHRIISQSGEEIVVLTQDESLMSDPNLSRSAASSRAIPVNKILAQVRENPAFPLHWGANQPGMQAQAEVDAETKAKAVEVWARAAAAAAGFIEELMFLGVHKQVANRLGIPFQYISAVVTATSGGISSPCETMRTLSLRFATWRF